MLDAIALQPALFSRPAIAGGMRVTLLSDQMAARDAVVQLWREGVKRIMVCAPTGSGKTVVASEFMRSCHEAGTRAVFVADQIQIVEQSVSTFRRYGLPIGITRGQLYGNHEQLVVASAQTLAREHRQPDEDPKLVMFDEAHVQHKAVMKWALETGARIVGLSATPLTAGLADYYEAVINITTTNELVNQGRLVPLVCYTPPVQVDHEGVRRNRMGAYDTGQLAQRSMKVTADVVSEWTTLKNKHFGPDVRVPTAVFTNTIEDGAAYAREFQQAGFDFRQTTYKSGDREMRKDILALFEAQEIDGIISCTALAKGWDSSIVMCVIDLQSNGASVAPVIQKYGRGMRIHADFDEYGAIHHKPVNDGIPVKDKCLILDHVGNIPGWSEELDEIWSNGVSDLVKTKRKLASKRREPREAQEVACRQCGFVLPKLVVHCPSCGAERAFRNPRKKGVNPGHLEEGSAKSSAAKKHGSHRKLIQSLYKDRPAELWAQVCSYTEGRYGDGNGPDWSRRVSGRRWFAGERYKDLMGEAPPTTWVYVTEGDCTNEVDLAIRAQLRAFMIRKQKAGA